MENFGPVASIIIVSLFTMVLYRYWHMNALSVQLKSRSASAMKRASKVRQNTGRSSQMSSSAEDLSTGQDDPNNGNGRRSSMWDQLKDHKMVLVVRTDIQMTKGKAAAQCCHACLAAYEKSMKRSPSSVQAWKRQGQPKITLKCTSEEHMLELEAIAQSLSLVAESICDAGHTQLDPGTRTVLCIGPAPSEEIDKVTGELKLY
ncbi:hypothetical protein MIR68_001234 [Amoeboaphelidium protococcarum]|nr:hypothetical protein MIR68_001234 [Amoeboaphelidium protococcarum]